MGGPAARHVDRQLQTNVPSAKLQSRLLKTDHDARVFIEEQGVSILFLALGMLRWFESSSSQEPRRAPLILIPVTLERSNVRERFRLKYTEEDLDDNLSLMNKLRLEFGIQLPQMPPQEDLDVAAYFDVVEESVRGEPRWSVDQDAVVLGFFSFGKLLMYRDLDKGNWPQGRGPSDHPIIKVLFDDNPSEAEAHLPEDEFLDRHLDPAEVHQVMDADSSQTLALLDVKSGRNLVVQGPRAQGSPRRSPTSSPRPSATAGQCCSWRRRWRRWRLSNAGSTPSVWGKRAWSCTAARPTRGCFSRSWTAP